MLPSHRGSWTDPAVAATPERRLSYRDLAAGAFLDGRLDEDFVFRGSGVSMLDRTAAILGFNSWTYQSGTVWLVRHELRELPLHVLAPCWFLGAVDSGG